MEERFIEVVKQRDVNGLLTEGVVDFLKRHYVEWVQKISQSPEESVAPALVSADDYYGNLLQTIVGVASAGHGDTFVERFARHLYDHDDKEQALYETYRDFMNERDTETARTEAVNEAKNEGMSDRFAERYAQLMLDEPRNARARKGARLYEEAFERAVAEGRRQAYAEAYANEVSLDEGDETYSRLYADAYEKAFEIEQIDSRLRQSVAETFAEEFYRHGGDHPCDSSYYLDKAILSVIGKSIERKRGVKGVRKKIETAFWQLLDPYEKNCLDREMRNWALSQTLTQVNVCIENGRFDDRGFDELTQTAKYPP